MLLFNIASYDVIGGVDFHVVLRWVLYVVHEVCWGMCEECVSCFVMLYNMNVLS